MKKRIAFIGAAMALAIGAQAASPTEQLVQQADAWDKAIIRKDSAAIAANMSEDFRQISARGDVASKAAFMEVITSPKLIINPYTVEDMDVRFYGDVALVSGRTRMTGSWDGTPFGSHYRYVDVYVRNMEHFDAIHRVRAQYFKEPLPASTMVEVTKMTSPDYLIEINAIAVVP